MSESVGRAGFNVRHLRHGESGTRGDRASLLRESMRELDDDAAAYYAANNPNIVAEDTHLNVAMVNDGNGGFRAAKSTAEVLAYGDARIGTKQNAEGEDRVRNTGRKWNPKSFETTLVVVSLPRSMCVEIPNVYELRDDDGNPVTDLAGNPVMRSRWVPRDRAEALRYFAQTADYLGDEVFAGGHDAIHGYDVNLDEAYPHMQLMADTLAENPSKPGELRVAAQQTWGVSREVLEASGKVEQPKAKMTRYQQGYREHMHGLGYEVELDASERSTSSHTREEWAALKERERIAEAFGDKVAAFSQKVTSDAEINKANAAKIAAAREQLDADLVEIEEAEGDLDERASDIAERETDWLTRKRRLDARERDLNRRDQEIADDRLAAQNERRVAEDAQRAAQRARTQAEADRQHVRDLVAKIEYMPPEVDDWLDRRKVGDGRTMRDLFNEDTKKRRATRAEVQALIDADAPARAADRTHGFGE